MKNLNWIYLVIVLLLSSLGFWFTFQSSGSHDWVSLHPIFLLVILLLIILWWLFDSLSLLVIFRTAGINIPVFIIIKGMLIGFFFGAITPFNTGTIPAILLYFKSQDLELKEIVSPVLMKSLLNGISRGVASLILAIYLKPLLSQKIGSIIQSLLLMYGSIILLIYFVLMNQSLLANQIRSFLAGFFFFLGRKVTFFSNQLAALGESIKISPERFCCLTKSYRWTIKAFLFIFLFWCAQLSIPYFILLSMGVHAPFLQSASSQASYYLLQPYLPTPGGSGVAEAGFGFLLKSLGGFQNPQFIFLWRIASFYFPLIIGGIFFIGNLTRKKSNP